MKLTQEQFNSLFDILNGYLNANSQTKAGDTSMFKPDPSLFDARANNQKKPVMTTYQDLVEKANKKKQEELEAKRKQELEYLAYRERYGLELGVFCDLVISEFTKEVSESTYREEYVIGLAFPKFLRKEDIHKFLSDVGLQLKARGFNTREDIERDWDTGEESYLFYLSVV